MNFIILNGIQEIFILKEKEYIFIAKTFRKTNFLSPLKRTRTYAYQRVSNVSFLKNFGVSTFLQSIYRAAFLWKIVYG